MDYEFACGSLQTVRAARMFYEYGKLDRLLERDTVRLYPCQNPSEREQGILSLVPALIRRHQLP